MCENCTNTLPDETCENCPARNGGEELCEPCFRLKLEKAKIREEVKQKFAS
jgi:hypothetical protein